MYRTLGFKLKEISRPGYVWFKNKKVFSRYQTQKHKLKDLLGSDNFNENSSESENMRNNGFVKIYDCGNAVYTIEFN